MKRLFDNFKESKKSNDKSIYTGVVTEEGVVKSSFMDECSMSFTFFAYTMEGADVIEESIYVTKEIPSLGYKVTGIAPLTVVEIYGEQVICNGQKRIKLDKVLRSNVPQRELEILIEKRRESLVYECTVLGKFELDRKLNWYEGKSIWRGKQIAVFLSGDHKNIGMVGGKAIMILEDQQAWDIFLKEKICEELLDLKNESWLEEEEDSWTAEAFISMISLESIVICEIDGVQMSFNDGDIFWGHTIMVGTDLERNIIRIDIAG